MKKIRILAIIVVMAIIFTIPVFTGCGKVAEFADPMTENIMVSMNNGDYAGFSKDFDANMKADLSEATFPDFLASVNGSVGNYKAGSKKLIGVNINNELTTVTYTVDFEQLEDVTVDVVFQKIDGQMKVVGLWFK